MEKEIRMMQLRVATPSPTEPAKMVVEGYAATINTPTVLYEFDNIKYWEVIAPGAFDGADMTDVAFRYNHSDDMFVMARTRSGTLTLTLDNMGLFMSAELADIQQARDLYTLIQRGDIDKMSFAFSVLEESYNQDTRTRTILKIKKLYDVAAVDMPAYDTTSISARSYHEIDIKIKRKRLLLMTL